MRAGSGTDLLLRALPGAPVLTVASAAELICRSFPAVNDAIARLTGAGVLEQITAGRRNRAFEAKEVVDAFTQLERQLASPVGDTRSSPPIRPVTPRPPKLDLQKLKGRGFCLIDHGWRACVTDGSAGFRRPEPERSPGSHATDRGQSGTVPHATQPDRPQAGRIQD